MPKNPVQDIISKRDDNNEEKIPIRRNIANSPIFRPKTISSPSIPRRPVDYNTALQEESFFSKYLYFIGAGAVILVLLFIFFSSRGVVEIQVTPKSETKEVNLSFVAEKNEVVEGDISFTLFPLSDERTVALPSQGTKEVDKRASGQILIFNNYSSDPQRLIARTRFETPEGRVFRIENAVTVPGVQVEEDKRIPGSIEAIVYADEPGEEYNVGFSDFTVPGLKGDPRFSRIFARAKTEIKGGFSGKVKVVDEKEQSKKKIELEQELNTAIRQKLSETLPKEKLFFENGIFMSFTERIQDKAGDEKGDDIPFTVSGEMQVLLFDEDEFAFLLGEEAGLDVESGVYVANLDEISIEIVDRDLIDIKSDKTITVAIKGKAQFVWPISQEEIKKSLAGKAKNEDVYQGVFVNEFPNIVEAKVLNFKPFWARKFPKNIEKIKIINTTEI